MTITNNNLIKILFIDFQGYFSGTDKELFNNMLSLPLGQMYLSSFLKERLNCKVKIIKSLVDFKTKEELLILIKNENPDFIGFRSLSLYLKELLETVTEIRKIKNFSKKIFLGGPSATSDIDALKKSNLFDKIISGAGEELVYQYLINETQNSTKNILDINELPFPDYSIIDFKKYENFIGFTFNKIKYAPILTSRGCPYKCLYCHDIFGKIPSLRTVDNIIEEIKYLISSKNIKNFCIIDDIFNINYERANLFFDKIIEENLDIKFYFPNGIRGDILDKDLIDKMIKAGTILITFAVESASNKIQNLIKKNLNLNIIKENIDYASHKNILVNVFYMIGFPGETLEEAFETLKFAFDLKLVTAPILNFVKYYEKTPLYNLAIQYGFSTEMLESSTKTLYQDPSKFRTPTLSNDNIREISQRFVYDIVGNPNRVEHMIKVLKLYFDDNEVLNYLNYIHPFFSDDINEFKNKIKLAYRLHKSTQFLNY